MTVEETGRRSDNGTVLEPVASPVTVRHRDDIHFESGDGQEGGFSGWAVDDSFLYRGNCDITVPLTDRCDFDELVATVRAIDPEVVYTDHGFDEAFADHLATEHGYRALPLKRDQTTPEECC